jgi:hypothetical protein
MDADKNAVCAICVHLRSSAAYDLFSQAPNLRQPMSDKLNLDNWLPEKPESQTETTNPPEELKKRSGGPRTPEGKMRSSQNARRHGILARVHIATPEDAAAFDAHLKDYLEAFPPVGVVERDLVIELASLRYRLRRIAGVEDSIFALGHDKFAASLSDHAQVGAALAQGMTWITHAKEIQLLGVYESRLRNAAAKTQAEIERIQSARKKAHAQAQQQAIHLAKVAAAQGQTYDGAKDFHPSADHGQFVYSPEEIARAADRDERLTRYYSIPTMDLDAA